MILLFFCTIITKYPLFVYTFRSRKLAGAQQGSIPDGAKELIDISSDDDDGEEQSPVKRTKRAEGVNHDNTTVSGAEALMSKVLTETVVKTNGQATPKEVGVAQDEPASSTSVSILSQI